MANIFKSYKEESRANWGAHMEESDKPNLEQIQAGAILRMADAVEKMATNYDQILRDRNNYKQWWQEKREYSQTLEKRIAGLKGQITKMRKQPPPKQK